MCIQQTFILQENDSVVSYAEDVANISFVNVANDNGKDYCFNSEDYLGLKILF